MKYDWVISDKDSSGNLEEKGQGEYKKLRSSLAWRTTREVQKIAAMIERDDENLQRITDFYMTRRPSRVYIEGLHQGWLVAGGEVESLDQFLARLIVQAQELVAERKLPTLITDRNDLAVTDLAVSAKVITEVETKYDSNRAVEDSGLNDSQAMMSDNNRTRTL